MRPFLRTFPLTTAARCVRQGGVIAYATEGVWGLGCDPFQPEAVARILALKGRSQTKGLILIAGEVGQLGDAVNALSHAQLDRLSSDPGYPLTWLIPTQSALPGWITGGSDRVAVRLTRHPQVAALCSLAGSALVSTSANPAGKPAALNALRVRQYFPRGLDYILPGELLDRGRASEIRDLVTDRVIRPRGKG